MATVPPLSLSAVQKRYPRLFQQYTHLSDRESDVGEDLSGLAGLGGQPPKVDPATGLQLVIMGNDFSAPLSTEAEDKGCPMTTDSDANKFAMFLWKVLAASESGSVGGDACRQFDALRAALYDARTLAGATARFEHLLGWTAAAANHQIDALLGRGDPDRNRLLFRAAADEWKKLFEANEEAAFVGDELAKFAKWQCGWFQQLLKQAKKEFGEHARYTFNFVKKPRPEKAPAAAVTPIPAAASTGPAASSSTNIVITKNSKDSKLGIGVDMEGGKLKVTSIAHDSVFVAKNLQVGMVIDRINGREFTTRAEAAAFIMSIKGDMKFAVSTAPAPDAVDASGNNVFATNFPPGTFEVTGPWEEDGWVPTTKSGKQKSPNMIRGQLQNYIDQCKMDGTRTQSNIIKEMGVNQNTFRRFMNPKTYKDQWSAVQNGAYWAAAKLLAKVKCESEMAKKVAKRKAAARDGNAAKKANVASGGFPSKSTTKEANDLIGRILAVDGVSESEVYDTCPQLVAKVKEFLARDGVTTALLLRAFGGMNSASHARFLAGKGQDQCGNQAYRASWAFFERLRILEGKPKSKARLKNEMEQIGGFPLVKSRGYVWKFLP